MDTSATGVTAEPCKDRKTGLMVFGILQIVLGGFCLMGLASIGLASLLPKPPGAEMTARTLVPGALVYLAMAAWFISMGIGSMRARRSARALILIFSWLWLISGVSGIAFMLVFFDSMKAMMQQQGNVPETVMTVILVFTLLISAVFYVVIPGILAFFYGSRHVIATCERLDPVPRWTDRCPVPVLAVSVMFGLMGVSLLFLGCYGWPVPCFGRIVSGAAGAGIVLAGVLLSGGVAWGAYRLDVRAWWGAVALATAWGLSSSLTFSRVGLMALYERMNLPAMQLEVMRPLADAMGPMMAPMCVGWMILVLGYLLYVRRFFPKSGAT